MADYQHPHGAAIDWSQVAAAGYKFAFIKATEGDYYANPYYAADLAQAKAAGLYATGYHFAIPNVSDGASQAITPSRTAATLRMGGPCRWRLTSSTTPTVPSATGCRQRS